MATDTRARIRWVAPVAALALALGGPVAFTSVVNADPALPEKTPEELVAGIVSAEPVAFSGTVSQQVNLGLPDLSALGIAVPGGHHGGAAPFDPMTLATGANTWRVWTDGEEAHKLALVVDGGEYSATYDGTGVWLWDSAAGEATHRALPEHDGQTRQPDAHPVTPDQFAQQALEHLEPTTTITTSGTRMVAGRPAYELVLTPDDAVTKVGSVRLAVDSETSLPLSFEVVSTAGTAAIDVAFTSISFAAPDDFAFTPPASATVTEVPAPSGEGMAAGKPGPEHSDALGSAVSAAEPIVVGEGWSTVVVLPAHAPASADEQDQPDGATMESPYGDLMSGLDAVVAQLPTVSGEWGSGKLFEGTVFAAVLADDGRVAIGAVGPEALYAALTQAR